MREQQTDASSVPHEIFVAGAAVSPVPRDPVGRAVAFCGNVRPEGHAKRYSARISSRPVGAFYDRSGLFLLRAQVGAVPKIRNFLHPNCRSGRYPVRPSPTSCAGGLAFRPVIAAARDQSHANRRCALRAGDSRRILSSGANLVLEGRWLILWEAEHKSHAHEIGIHRRFANLASAFVEHGSYSFIPPITGRALRSEVVRH